MQQHSQGPAQQGHAHLAMGPSPGSMWPLLPLAALNGPYRGRMGTKKMEMARMTVTGPAGGPCKCVPLHSGTSWKYPRPLSEAS